MFLFSWFKKTKQLQISPYTGFCCFRLQDTSQSKRNPQRQKERAKLPCHPTRSQARTKEKALSITPKPKYMFLFYPYAFFNWLKFGCIAFSNIIACRISEVLHKSGSRLPSKRIKHSVISCKSSIGQCVFISIIILSFSICTIFLNYFFRFYYRQFTFY